MSIREISTDIIEVPILAELHMPGEIIEYTYIGRQKSRSNNLVGVKAKGYCLKPAILDGDILIKDKDAIPEIGKTILCYHNGEEHPCLIRYKRSEDLKDCTIYGVIIAINRKI
jgi:hypothetical protein